ncbi:MAG: DUF3349 domain-containing protein [Gordonia sp. (in: high G+C Gram-positive bacteria)]|uniref:DUF3349 domain-containing protein n=1 Tax=Gordonia sp. (in: high G+C Gram-positive bacteria) TaxID=84139 RepID=UPI0039E3B580
MTAFSLQAIVNWLRTGYPNGVPEHDYQPLFALLRRQLSEDEVGEVAGRLSIATPSDAAVDRVDTGVAITRVTDETPLDRDVARVRARLEEAGWPFDDVPLDPADHPAARDAASDEEDL